MHSQPQQGAVVVVGIDGLTYSVLDPLLSQGKLPHFSRFKNEGAWGTMRSERPMRSPALWTTVATGQSRDKHQIYDFVTGSAFWPEHLKQKKQKLVTSGMRKVPALWHYLSQAQQKSLIVGWLNTWPAEPIHGVMIAPYVALGKKKQTSIKGKVYQDARGQSHPAALFTTLKPQIVNAHDIDLNTIKTFMEPPPTGHPLHRVIPRLDRYTYTLKWSLASAETNIRLIEYLLARDNHQDLIMTYFDGTDTLAHRFWLFRQPLSAVRARLKAHGIPPKYAKELQRRYHRVLDAFYEHIDTLLGRLLQAVGENATVIILSDHGWGDWQGGAHAPYSHVPFDGEHRMDGVLMALGPNIRADKIADASYLYDIAPTVMHLRDLALPAELPGKVIDMMRTDWNTKHPIRRKEKALLVKVIDIGADAPASKKPEGTAPTPKSDFEDEELKRLRELGYVQ